MNKHLTTYLDYYRTQENPGYAVLITGGWGSGKTYQIKKYFKEHEICYVSLFSINSIDDIYATVFAKMFPGKVAIKKLIGSIGDIKAKVLDSVTLGLGGILSRIGSVLIKENIDNKKIIIFDDLERAVNKNIISINEVLGVINNYIEHAGCKVIVIAHDEKIKKEFESEKEKVIGQTIKVRADVDDALNSFLANSELRRKHPKIKDILLSVFNQSGYSSLRVLKYAIKDCDRLYDIVKNSKLSSNDKYMCDFFHYFIILCIEFKNGNLSVEEYLKYDKIHREYQYAIFSKTEINTPNIIIIQGKYTGFVFLNELISNDVVVDIILNGYLECNKINKKIDESNYFKEEEEKPSWYKFTSFDRLESDAIDLASQEVKTDFTERKFNKFGDIYHLFNCMFLLEMQNEKQPNYNGIYLDCKNYIDDVFNNGKIEIKNPKKMDPDIIFSSYEGRSFWIEPVYSSYSQEILDYINKKMHEAYYKKQEKYDVLSIMKNDLNDLSKDLTHYDRNHGEYCDVPILHKISALSFVEAWLSLPASQQRDVSSLLQGRYEMGRLSSSLKDEKKWLENVFVELDKKADSMKGLHSYRIKRLKLYIPID